MSPRPNGEIWALAEGHFPSAFELRLFRLTSRGEIIRPADGSIGEWLPRAGDHVGFAGSSVLAHDLTGGLIVRRWNLEF